MLFDLQSMFSDQQAITGDAASTNIIDLGAKTTPQHAVGPITSDMGKGRPIPLHIQVTETFNTLTSLDVSVEVDDNAAFSSAKVVATVNVLLAALVAGKRIAPFYIPEGVDERYVRLNYNVNGTDPTTGKITAGLVFGRSNWAV